MTLNDTQGRMAPSGANAFPYRIDYAMLLDGVGDALYFTPSSAGDTDEWAVSTHIKGSPRATDDIFTVSVDASNKETFTIATNCRVDYSAYVGGVTKADMYWEAFPDPTAHYSIVLRRSGTSITLEVDGDVVTPTIDTVPASGAYLYNTTVVHHIGHQN